MVRATNTYPISVVDYLLEGALALEYPGGLLSSSHFLRRSAKQRVSPLKQWREPLATSKELSV